MVRRHRACRAARRRRRADRFDRLHRLGRRRNLPRQRERRRYRYVLYCQLTRLRMTVTVRDQRNLATIKGLTYLMFMMFAMTTDSVGVIIPEVIKEFDLSMTAAGAFHYTSMTAIALSGILLGHLADRLGRKATIIAGLTLFAISSFLFAAGHAFSFFILLLVIS